MNSVGMDLSVAPSDQFRKTRANLRDMGFTVDHLRRSRWGDVMSCSLQISVVDFLASVGIKCPKRVFSYSDAKALGWNEVSNQEFIWACANANRYAPFRRMVSEFLGYTVEELWPHLSLPTVAERTAYKKDMEARKAAGSDDTAAPEPQPLWRGLDQAKCAQDVNKEHSLLEDQSALSAQPDNLPAPTAPWMGELHRAFSASPADTSNAVLRRRVRELEAENVRLRSEAATGARVDEFYNRGRAQELDALAKRQKHLMLSKLDRCIAALYPEAPGNHPDRSTAEMAAWPPIYEVPRAQPVIRFLKWLAA